MKHNKKRNTAFIYEALIQELTKSIVSKDTEKKKTIVSILKEHFSKGKILNKELSLYKDILETTNMDKDLAEKLLFEAKVDYECLSKHEIFREQSKVINRINKEVSQSVFSNFVKNYKDYATLSQVFNSTAPVKQRVLLEEGVIKKMTSGEEIKEQESLKPLDELTYKTFIKKFNDKYGDSLLKEQKELLSNFVLSFSDNGLSLKVFLNEELERVKKELVKCSQVEEIKKEPMLVEKTNKIMEKLELFREKSFDQEMLFDLLRIQHFVNEAQIDG